MNLPTIKHLMAAVLLLSALPASAQKMITFESKSGHSTGRRHRQADNGKNALSIGLVSWINGYTPVYYERAITGVLSIQVGAGFTTRSYMNDLGMAIWADGDNNSEYFRNGNDIADHYEYYKFRKAGVGPYLSIAPRIYFGSDKLLNGAYVSPMLEYKSYRYKAQLADESRPISSYYGVYDDRDIPHVGQTIKEFMNCTDLTINIGGHYQTGNHMAIGWSIGLGVRHIASERLDLGEQEMPDGQRYYDNSVVSYSKTKPLFNFNFTIGGWF